MDFETKEQGSYETLPLRLPRPPRSFAHLRRRTGIPVGGFPLPVLEVCNDGCSNGDGGEGFIRAKEQDNPEKIPEENLAGIVSGIIRDAGYTSSYESHHNQSNAEGYQLTAQIRPLDDFSMTGCSRYLKQLIEIPNIDVAVLELPDKLAEIVKTAIDSKGKSFGFNDIGHISLVLGYFIDIRPTPFFYGNLNDAPEKISAAKQDLVSNKKQHLYMICCAENKEHITNLLAKEGFKISD